MSGEHSILAPSDAERWARCVGAVALSKGLPDIDKEYNASGSCSHWILEQSLKNEISPDVFLGKTLEFGGFKFVIDEDRIDRVRSTMTNIYREPGQMWVEHELKTSPVIGVPNQIGHADVIKLDPLGSVFIKEVPYTGVLSIHDFKDGYIRVMAQDNLQGILYLAAALYEFEFLADINALRFCIHQPKIGHYDEWSYTRKEIEDFTIAIRPVAKLAYDIYYGTVEFDPTTHLTAGETQCFWCPVRGRCPARAKRIVDLFADIIAVHEIDDAHLGKLYMRLDEIEQACRDYREEALRRARIGHKVEGHKLIHGKRGKRTWGDEGKAETALSLLIDESKMYEPRALISPTEAEKQLKKNYALVEPYVERKSAGLILVPDDDPHPAVELPDIFELKPEKVEK